MDASPLPPLPQDWSAHLHDALAAPSFKSLETFLEGERAAGQTVFPPHDLIFSAFRLTPFEAVRVLILGQDPYHDVGQAHGLAFSVLPGVKPPPSLANIFKELHSDVGARVPNNGDLVPWAKQGVMLLNTVLTVRAHQANSHQKKGWEPFTDAVIQALAARATPLAFVLWGKNAQSKAKLIDAKRHLVLQGVHPSPLSARQGFFGSKPFSTLNAWLVQHHQAPVDWQLPDV